VLDKAEYSLSFRVHVKLFYRIVSLTSSMPLMPSWSTV